MRSVETGILICGKCDREMQLMDVSLSYLGHQLTVKLPRCPVCKQVYLSEEVVTDKIQRVERELEDK